MQLNMQIIQDKIRVDPSSSAFWTEQNFWKKKNKQKETFIMTEVIHNPCDSLSIFTRCRGLH